MDRNHHGECLEMMRVFMETRVRGVFAAGDVRGGSTKRIASAVGKGASAAIAIRKYLKGA